MNILHVIASLDPAHGGPPAVASRLAAAQAARGHQVTVLTYSHPSPEVMARTMLALGGVPYFERCRVELVRAGDWREKYSSGLAIEVLDRLARTADVLHLHGVWERLLLVAAKAAQIHAKGYVVCPSGMLDPWSLQQSKWKKKLALLLGYRKMLERSLFLHALNEEEARGIARLRLRCPVEIFPNGVFLEEFDPLPAEGTFRRKHKGLGDRPYVLFLGRLHYKKGLDFLAEAFALAGRQVPNLALVVAGPNGGAREDFERRIAATGLSHRVHVVGPLYGQEKIAAMVDAACFCLPSRQEGFSLAVTEALACGLPVVISEACHFSQAGESGAGIIVNLESQEIAQALTRVAGDADLRGKMGQAGRELVAGRYTWAQIAGRMVEAYERRLGGVGKA